MGLNIGTLYIRRSIFIQATPARVWQEFKSDECIKAWLNRGHTLHLIEPYVGGLARFSVTIDGAERGFGGSVLVYETERELSFESQWHDPQYQWPLSTYWTLRLTGLYDGTQVELFHHGFERLGELAADSLQAYEQGWDSKHLQALRAIVEQG